MKKMFQKTVAMAVVCLASIMGSARADTLALYTFAGNSRTSTDADTNSSAGSFSDGPGFTTPLAPAGSTTFVSGAIAVLANATDGSDQPTTVAANDYFSFTINPNSGVSLNLSTLTFDTSTSGIIGNYFVRSNVDGFANNLAVVQQTTAQGTTPTARSADVSGTSFDNLTLPTEFRFYIFDGSGSSAQNVRLDNVTLTGTTSAVTAVPEPGTITLMLLGLAGVGGGAARKRKKAEQEEAETLASA